MICNKEHRYLPELHNLPENQGGPGRHKCAGCAYERGYDDAINGHGRYLNMATLDESQSGTGRHIDPQAVYDLGYSNGQRRI